MDNNPNPDPNNTNAPDQVSPSQSVQPTTTTEPIVSSASPTPPSPPEIKKSKRGLAVLALVVLFVTSVGVAGYAGHKIATDKAEQMEQSLNNQIRLATSTDYAIPEGAVKVSECIPGMGAHYLLKGGDKEYGPFALVNKQEKVIGLEYMASADMFRAIPNTDPPVSVIPKISPMLGWKFDHAEFSSLPKGHDGLERNHIDVHLFTVSEEEQKNSCK